MESNEKKDKGIAVAGTIVVHALAVLVLFLMAFRTPLPLPGEEGVEVDLGMMNQGMGNIQPDKPAIPVAAQPQQQQSKSKEDIVTQNDEEAPAIEQPKINKPKQETKPVEQPKQTSDPRAIYHSSNNSQDGGSEGITGQPGDQGKPNGLADVHQYEGPGGSGNGVTYNLGGRGAKHLENRALDELPEEGIIVVEIWVNPDGKVIRAKAGAKGTEVSNLEMRKIAEKYALSSTFNSKKDAPPEQHGTITYNFHRNYNK